MLVTNTVKKQYQVKIEALAADDSIFRSILHLDASSPEEARLLAQPRVREVECSHNNLKFVNCVVQEAGPEEV